MKIYVAAPFEKGPFVLSLHSKLEALGHEPVSRWAHEAGGGKDALHTLSQQALLGLCAINDKDVVRADVLVALVSPGLGKEMYCEAAFARLLGKPIVWVGDEAWMPLSAFRRKSRRVQDVAALLVLMGDLVGADGLERFIVSLEQV